MGKKGSARFRWEREWKKWEEGEVKGGGDGGKKRTEI